MADSKIEWTDKTWNPVTGCDKISPGCKHCYAERMAERLQRMGQPNYRNGFELNLQHHMLKLPLTWKKPQNIFVNSMSDLFHKDVPVGYIQQVFDVMRRAHWHRFQVLTKRADRLAELGAKIEWAPNIWQGVSVESTRYRGRIDALRSTKAKVKFLSLEPLLGPLPKLDLTGIHWVIVGGESGPKARPMNPAWVTDIRDQCIKAGVPFFFKQWGGVNKKKAGRILEGRTWDEMPADPAGTPEPAGTSPRRVFLPVLPVSPQDKPPRPDNCEDAMMDRVEAILADRQATKEEIVERLKAEVVRSNGLDPAGVHEAGHALMRHRHGGKVLYIQSFSRRTKLNAKGVTMSRPGATIPLAYEVSIILAGYVAQAEYLRIAVERGDCWPTSRPRTSTDWSNPSEQAFARVYLSMYREGAGTDLQDARSKLSVLPEGKRFATMLAGFRLARQILRAHWPAVIDLAASLTVHRRVSGKAVRTILAAHRVHVSVPQASCA